MFIRDGYFIGYLMVKFQYPSQQLIDPLLIRILVFAFLAAGVMKSKRETFNCSLYTSPKKKTHFHITHTHKSDHATPVPHTTSKHLRPPSS
ncbi:hypothetical protein, partial [Legionella taurinensis]|uniref:hypothetical protein n=1 Tax=Legionella taurinensis TaxID=70611 RepID=UPI001C7D6AA7